MKLALKINCDEVVKKTIAQITTIEKPKPKIKPKKHKFNKAKKVKPIILTEEQKEAKKVRIAAKRKVKLTKNALKVVETLAKTYTKTFTLKRTKKPLKVNILQDILDTKLCKKNVLVKALQLYCHKNYTKNLIVGADRYDLSGNAVGKVTEGEFERKSKPRGFKASCEPLQESS